MSERVDLTDEPKDATRLPPEIEAEIAVRWSDNIVAAQLTRTYARAMLHQEMDVERVRAKIRESGRIVD